MAREFGEVCEGAVCEVEGAVCEAEGAEGQQATPRTRAIIAFAARGASAASILPYSEGDAADTYSIGATASVTPDTTFVAVSYEA